MAHWSIEIDCPPGQGGRQQELFASLLKGSGLSEEDWDFIGATFGCWEWRLKPGELRENLYEKHQPNVAKMLKEWQRGNLIRYGSW